MNKINFQNLPSTSTPVNATNLNQMQTNVENVFKVLGEGILSSSNDLSDCNNTSLATGIYYATGSASNAPFSSAWYIIHLKRDTTNITQFAIRYSNNQIFERHYNTVNPSGWKDWKEVGVRSILTATLSSAYTIATSSTYEKIPLSLLSLTGSGLTLSNNLVTVGANISKVLVSATVLNAAAASGRKYFRLYKNNTDGYTVMNYVTNGEPGQLMLTPTIMDVTQGDTIGLYIYGTQNDSLYADRTFMTVEALD